MTIEFEASQNGMMHGFAGYFDSKLYGDVYMSIHPKTHSPGMFSWFPIYFPLRVRRRKKLFHFLEGQEIKNFLFLLSFC